MARGRDPVKGKQRKLKGTVRELRAMRATERKRKRKVDNKKRETSTDKQKQGDESGNEEKVFVESADSWRETPPSGRWNSEVGEPGARRQNSNQSQEKAEQREDRQEQGKESL